MVRTENTEVIDLFEEFYRNYYRSDISELAQQYPDETKSLYIDWQDLHRFDQDLADNYRNNPDRVQGYAEEALRRIDPPVDVNFEQANVRIQNLPATVSLSDIRSDHCDQLLAVEGTVRAASAVTSKPTTVAWECQRCGTLTRIPQSADDFEEPHECQGCERTGPFRVNYDQSELTDERRIRIEAESDGRSTSHSIIVILEDDVVGDVVPGDRIRVTGTLKLVDLTDSSAQMDATIPDKYILASSLEESSRNRIELDTTDKQAIVKQSEDTDLYDQIVDSIAPHVHGHEEVKIAVALQLFGGVTKHSPDESRIRGDIHINIAADPGTRMEEIAEYAKRVAPHSVRANGAETTAVGLTSSAYKSKSNRKNWEADAGTLVLGDGGLTCITQTEQLSEDAQTALQQVMHEQIVETSKATVNQTLPARTAILGISKPKYGRFDQYEPIAEQFDLTPSLVSRSDLVFAVIDQPDTEQDLDIADHTLSANYAGEVNTQRANADKSGHSQQDVEEEIEAIAPPIGPDLFRKYISYAKRNVFPTMSPDAKDTIRDFYVDVRSRGDDDSPVPVTSRKLEALVRLAEASARMRLDDTVRQADAERVIDVVEFSLKTVGTDPEKEELDEDVVAGQSQSQHDRAKNMKALIQEIELRHDLGAPVEDVLEQAQKAGMARSKAEHEIDKLKHKGEIYEPASDHLRTT